MNALQVLIVVVALAAVVKAWRTYAGGQMDKRKVIGWTALWMIGVFVILLPDTTSWFAEQIGVGRGVDAVVYVSVVVLFFTLFQTSRKVDKLERQLTKLVRAIALENAKRNDNSER